MVRGIRIVVALAAVVLLVRPLDCFASAKSDQNAIDCCKATVEGGDQLLASSATDHATPALDLVIADVIWLSAPPPTPMSGFVRVHAHPGSPPDSRLSLPLLI